MLTWEGSWPNSLVRRPPWLQACSVKNKQSCKFQVSLLRLVQKQRIKSKIAEKQVSWKLKTFCFSGVSKLGFPNLGSRPDIENPAFQSSCSNPNWYWKPEKNPFQTWKGQFLVYFNRANMQRSGKSKGPAWQHLWLSKNIVSQPLFREGGITLGTSINIIIVVFLTFKSCGWRGTRWTRGSRHTGGFLEFDM